MRALVSLVAAILVASAFAGTAGADAVYHTDQLALHGVAGAPGGGSVVNVHANGPEVFAHEIYTLRDAVPGTYEVSLNLFATSLDCSGGVASFPTATLTTNANGNGRADAKFTPEDAADLRGLTISISWTVSGPAMYATDCTVVTLD
jgi:hypothetical protein